MAINSHMRYQDSFKCNERIKFSYAFDICQNNLLPASRFGNFDNLYGIIFYPYLHSIQRTIREKIRAGIEISFQTSSFETKARNFVKVENFYRVLRVALFKIIWFRMNHFWMTFSYLFREEVWLLLRSNFQNSIFHVHINK